MPDVPLQGLDLDPDAVTPQFQQLYEALRRRIQSGGLARGDRLPASRKLAEELGLSRTTIVAAYDQLIAEGFAHGRTGSGVYVSEIGPLAGGGAAWPESAPVAPLSPAPQPPGAQPPITDPRPLQPGIPDARLFPYRQWAKVLARVARTEPQSLVRADDPFGDPRLRAEICRYLADWRGVRAGVAQVLVTAGAADGLELCIRTLTGPGDAIALEDPGYPPLRAFVDSLGLPVVPLATDGGGATPPDTGQPGPGTRLAVLTPSCQFPLGGVMPQRRRNAFLAWAARGRRWILEDDYDSEFRYAGRPVPALAGLDRQGRTLYLGSFSKVFSNGLRLGFVVLPPALIPVFAETLRRFGGKASRMPQRPLAQFMESGEYYRHIRRVRRIYGERRAVFLDLLRDHLEPWIRFDDHRAGMQVAVELVDGIRDTEVVAAAARRGVACTALSAYYQNAPVRNGMLLGFCAYSAEEMVDALGVLKQVIAAASR